MASPDTVFIVNPQSRGGTTATQGPRVAARAQRILGGFKTSVTRIPGDAGSLAAGAAPGAVK